jgi:hypothetical protein
MTKTFQATIVRDGPMCFIPVPFDPRPVFGKVRAPVKVTLNGHTYRSTIASMGNGPCLPLRRSNREAAGLEGGETVRVTLALDADKREVEPPRDLVRALKQKPPAWARWGELSYSHQREHVEALEQAKKPETRTRRIEAAVKMLAARPPRRKSAADAKGASRPRLNAAWHDRHPMPSNATTRQRMTWHQAHAKSCGCRPIPVKLRVLLQAERP